MLYTVRNFSFLFMQLLHNTVLIISWHLLSYTRYNPWIIKYSLCHLKKKSSPIPQSLNHWFFSEGTVKIQLLRIPYMNYSSRYWFRSLYSALSFQFWNNLLIQWKFFTFFSGDSGIGDVSFALEIKNPQEKVLHLYLCINKMSQITSGCKKSLHVYTCLHIFMWNPWTRGQRAETPGSENASQFTPISKKPPLLRIFDHY